MNALTITLVVLGAAGIVSVFGYVVRQYIVRHRAETLERKFKEQAKKAEQERENIVEEARRKAKHIEAEAQAQQDKQRRELLATEQLLMKREQQLAEKSSLLERKEQELRSTADQLHKDQQSLDSRKEEVAKKLETVAELTQEEARKAIFERVEEKEEKAILDRIRQLEASGAERFEQRAKDIIAYAVQKTAVAHAQEITTTTVSLPSEEIKGKIIGKEGRNIRSLERAAGVEIVVDEAPETVVISGFDPVRRHVAKVALERLIQDGRIHPARVEEEVARAQQEIDLQMRQAGEAAIYEVGLVGVDPKLIQLLGRLKFRTSYGQNVLLHSIEVAYLASALASEIGVNAEVAKKAGLFHDIGKALDHQVEGSHVAIGMRILEKFGMEQAVIDAMKAHHEEFPYESVEAVIVQTADAISASRPGARKDTLENYLKRIGDLERLASSFPGIERAYAIQAGREIRIFVKPEDLSDLQAQQTARDIANRIQEELRYPGEIKVTLIRENRFVEYAR